MSKTPLTKDALIDKLVDVVYDYGYDGATLSMISEVTGLGKASLYHHFPGGKEQMAAEVLAHSDRWGAEYIEQLLASDQPAQAKVRGLFRALENVHTRAHQLTLMNVFTFGTARQVFGQQVSKRAKAGLEVLAQLLQQCGIPAPLAKERALDAYIQVEGAMVLARALDDLDVFRHVVQRLPDQLMTLDDAQRLTIAALTAVPSSRGMQ